MPTYGASQTITAPDGEEIRYSSGDGAAAEAGATAELTAVLGMVVGTTKGNTRVSYGLDNATPPINNTDQYQDATFVFAKGTGANRIVRTRKIRNVTLDVLEDPGNSNAIDLEHPLVTALEGAYRGPDGTAGYTIIKAYFNDK